MTRIVLAFVLADSILVALIVWLFLQKASLEKELATRPAAGAPAEAGGAAAKGGSGSDAEKRIAELEKALSDRETQAKNDKERLEKEAEDLRRQLAAAKKAREEKKEGGIKSIEELLKKHQQALIYGADIPEDVIKALGLEPAQVVSLKMAMDEELRRLDEAMQRFYTANMEGATAESANKSAKDLIMSMMGPIANDMKEFGKMPLEDQLKIHTTSSIEETLGEDRFLSKLCKEVHTVRLQTYKELERSLSPEQIETLRQEYLREGMLAYDEQFKLEFGAAPKDMKK
jgi:hypothetical protein